MSETSKTKTMGKLQGKTHLDSPTNILKVERRKEKEIHRVKTNKRNINQL